LSGVTENLYMHSFVSSTPESPADTMLTECVDLQIPMALGNRLLYVFFKNP
jgi:hypothetical protein